MAVDRHLPRVLIRHDPHTAHLRLDLAVTIGADAPARPVAQIFGALHRAGHAGGVEDALAAVVAAKQALLGEVLGRSDQPLDASVADLGDQRVERPGRALGGLIGFLKKSRTVAEKSKHALSPFTFLPGAAWLQSTRAAHD